MIATLPSKRFDTTFLCKVCVAIYALLFSPAPDTRLCRPSIATCPREQSVGQATAPGHEDRCLQPFLSTVLSSLQAPQATFAGYFSFVVLSFPAVAFQPENKCVGGRRPCRQSEI